MYRKLYIYIVWLSGIIVFPLIAYLGFLNQNQSQENVILLMLAIINLILAFWIHIAVVKRKIYQIIFIFIIALLVSSPIGALVIFSFKSSKSERNLYLQGRF